MIGSLCKAIVLGASLTGLLGAVAARAQEARTAIGTGSTTLLLHSTTDIEIIRPTLERFSALNPDLRIEYERWGSNDLYANSLEACAGDEPVADAVFSSAVHQMVSLVNAGCAAQHRSAFTDALPPARRWRNELWGITEEPAVIAYNKVFFAEAEVPRDRFALLDLLRTRPDALRGRIATYDIEASGLGYLFAYSDSLEATTFGALLEGFSRTEAIATCCSAEIIEGVAEGRYLLAYHVLGSYVEAGARPEVGLILPEDYTLFLSRGFMIPKGAPQAAAARRLLDYLLSPDGQARLSEAGLIFPQDATETGLLPSARRFIALAPSLLVALDQHRIRQFSALFASAFRPSEHP